MNKKAVSPLVATILLIAFAVSLGAIIMNWTVDSHVEEGLSSNSICDDVSIHVLLKDSEPAICYDRELKRIVFDIENGDEVIEGLRISYIGKNSNFIDHHQKVESGILKHIEVGYDASLEGELNNVKIIPFIKKEDLLYCSSKGKSFSIIKDCN